jgi:hypothetical protein
MVLPPATGQIAEFEQQIEKRNQVIGELTVANRILKNSRDSPSERRDTFCDHRGVRRGVFGSSRNGITGLLE